MSESLHDSQRAEVGRLKDRWLWRSEAATQILIATIYSGWYWMLSNWQRIGPPSAIGILIFMCAWFKSLQHELLHRHPSGWRWVNRFVGYPLLAVWAPYSIYRDTQITHHCNENLTFLGLDPESYFVLQEKRKYLGRGRRAVLTLRNSTFDRLGVGALLSCFAARVNGAKVQGVRFTAILQLLLDRATLT